MSLQGIGSLYDWLELVNLVSDNLFILLLKRGDLTGENSTHLLHVLGELPFELCVGIRVQRRLWFRLMFFHY